MKTTLTILKALLSIVSFLAMVCAIYAFSDAQTLLGVIALLLAGFALAGLYLSHFKLGDDLSRLTLDLEAIASGKRDIPFNLQEAGQSPLFRALKIIQQKFKTLDLYLAKEVMAKEAEQKALNAELIEIAEGLDKQVKETGVNVAQNVSLLKFVSEQMSSKADMASERMQELADISQSVGSSVDVAASDTKQLQTDIQDIGNKVSDAAATARDAVNKAEHTRASIQGLSEAADRIGDVVTMITEIAEQTNLLALNATIEAARAGEAGKGFAVVASEVKNLANQTGKATEEIQAQISNVQAATTKSAGAIEEISEVVTQIDTISTSIQETVEVQIAATNDITDRIMEAAKGSQGVSQSSTEILEAVTTTNEMSQEVKNTAEQSAQDVDNMTARLTELMGNLRRSALGNRREYTRYAVTDTARLTVDGQSYEASIIDMSEGGALLQKMPYDLQETSSIDLKCEGLDVGLSGHIYRISQKGIHLEFSLEASQLARLKQYLSTFPEASEANVATNNQVEEDDIDLF